MQAKSAEALHELAVRVLKAAGAAGEAAEAVAAEVIAAEHQAMAAHGLARLPELARALRAGEVDGWAQPEVSLPATAVVRVDAKGGFAAPALDYAIAAIQEVVDQQGTAAATVVGHRHPGLLAIYAEKLRGRGLLALVVSDTAVAGAITLVAADPAAMGVPAGVWGQPRRSGTLAVAPELYDALVLMTRGS